MRQNARMPDRSPARAFRPGLAAAAALLAAAVAGCGGEQTPVDAATGPQIFEQANCASCHRLAAADASGSIGPDLDERRPSADRVRAVVTDGASGMPSFKSRLSAEQIDTLAQWVSEAAGR